MFSTLGGLPLLPGRLMISVLPGFFIRVDMLNEPELKPLRKFLQVPFKIRIPVLWLPVTPAPLAARAMRKVILHNHGALTLPAVEGFPRLLAGVAAVL